MIRKFIDKLLGKSSAAPTKPGAVPLGKRAEIAAAEHGIDPKLVDADGRCVFGATVDVEDEAGDKSTYQIVGEDEADIKIGKLSYSSPIARALIGKFSGDVAEGNVAAARAAYDYVRNEMREASHAQAD